MYLAFFIAVVVYLGLTGCGSPTKMLLSESSSQGTVSSPEPSEKTSNVSRTVYTYMAQEQIELEPPTAPSPVTGSVKLDKKRLVVLSGIIDETMFNKANELVALSDDNDDPIDVVISSPGGSVSHGLMLIQAMKEVKAKGITIRCYVPTLAASMAYVIFTQCSERYALPYATLLFHSPRVFGTFVITAQNSRQLANGLTQLENQLLGMILPVMGVTRENGGMWFVEAYQEERLFLATELYNESPVKWLTVVAEIKGFPGKSFPAPYPTDAPMDRRNVRAPKVQEAGR